MNEKLIENSLLSFILGDVYDEFIKWVALKTNATNIFIGMYYDGEPFCSGNFGEISYMRYLRHHESK